MIMPGIQSQINRIVVSLCYTPPPPTHPAPPPSWRRPMMTEARRRWSHAEEWCFQMTRMTSNVRAQAHLVEITSKRRRSTNIFGCVLNSLQPLLPPVTRLPLVAFQGGARGWGGGAPWGFTTILLHLLTWRWRRTIVKDMGQQMGYRSLEWNWPKEAMNRPIWAGIVDGAKLF